VTLSPRAALFIAPTLIVTAGAIFLSRHVDISPVAPDRVSAAGPDNMLEPLLIDSDAARIIYEKQTVALDLLCGRCSLEEAADRFYQLSKSFPGSLDRLHSMWPGRTDRERAMFQALSYARSLVRRDPQRLGEAMVRIDSEAKAQLNSSVPLN
jgi:hypothetical protein